MKKTGVNTIVVEYNGYKFVKDKRSGYYLSSKPLYNGKRIHLHRYIWINEVGEIPEGMVVHHVDHNKDNNCIENFKLESKHEHSSYHSKKRCAEDPDTARKFIERTNEKAKAWHRSEEGHRWHVEHAKNSIGKPQIMITKVCEYCGKEYQVGASYAYKSKYCCRNHKMYARNKRIKDAKNAEGQVC